MTKVVHFEVPVDDPDRARAFYSSLFGWELAAYGDQQYWLTSTEQSPEPGADGALIARSEIHAAPVIVIGVESIADTLGAAEQAGAEVLMGRQAIPSIGFSAYLRDTEGNVIGLFEPAEHAGS